MRCRAYGLFAACAAAVVAISACHRADDTASKPTAHGQASSATDSAAPQVQDTPTARGPRAELATVYLTDDDGKEHPIRVEIVRTRRAIQRGLMYRQHLPEHGGMLFLMGTDEVQSFWMRNTLIALDMLFIRKDMTVAGIVKNAKPLTETSRSVGKPSLYVLEVNGGWTTTFRVSADSKVRFDGVTR